MSVLHAVVGGSALVLITVSLRRLFARGRAGGITLPPGTAALLVVMSAVLLIALVAGTAGVADQPLVFLLPTALSAAILAKVAFFGPGDGRVAPSRSVRWPVVVKVLLPLLIAAVALSVAWISDETRSRPVDALSVVPGGADIRVHVAQAADEHRVLTVRVVAEGRVFWSSKPLTAGETTHVVPRAGVPDSAIVQLLADGQVIRAVKAR
jgi:hypothetical protein